jgi:capsid protein
MRVNRPGQVRGVPLIASAVVKLWLLDQYDDAELDRKKTAALFAGFITSPQPEDILEPDGDAGAPAGTVTLEPGTGLPPEKWSSLKYGF